MNNITPLFITTAVVLLIIISCTTTNATVQTLYVTPTNTNYATTCGLTDTDGCPDIVTALNAYRATANLTTDSLVLTTTAAQLLTGSNNTDLALTSNIDITFQGFNVDLRGKAQFILLSQTDPISVKITLQSCTLLNGYSDNNGAFIMVSSGSAESVIEINVISSVMQGGKAMKSGGAISFIGNNGVADLKLSIIDSQFNGNLASAGNAGDKGAVLNTLNVAISITGSTFNNNTIVDATGYGVIYSNYGTLSIANTLFTNNTVTRLSILHCQMTMDVIALTNVTFTENHFFQGGFLVVLYSAKATIAQSTFVSNYKATAIFVTQLFSSLAVQSSTFSGFSHNQYGGVLRADPSVTFSFDSCTMTGNSAINGGVIYSDSAKQGTLTNCTLTDNAADIGGAIYVKNTIFSMTGGALNSNQSPIGDDIYCNKSTITLKGVSRIPDPKSGGAMIVCDSSDTCKVQGDNASETCTAAPNNNGSSNDNSSDRKKGLSTGKIIGIVIGGIIGALVIIGFIWIMKKRHYNRSKYLPVR
eukprot:gene7922-9306_t